MSWNVFLIIIFPTALSYHVDSADGAQTGNVELGEDDCGQPWKYYSIIVSLGSHWTRLDYGVRELCFMQSL